MGGRRLQAVDGGAGSNTSGLGPKVAETLDALDLGPADQAIAQLLREYAAQVDRAAAIAASLAKMPAAPDFEEELGRMRARVSAHGVLIDLGPKIQAALTALKATPASRSDAKPARSGGGKLTAMRGGA